MQKKKKIKNNAEKLVARVAVKVAGLEVNSACAFFAYQPEEPKVAKKLRKFFIHCMKSFS